MLELVHSSSGGASDSESLVSRPVEAWYFSETFDGLSTPAEWRFGPDNQNIVTFRLLPNDRSPNDFSFDRMLLASGVVEFAGEADSRVSVWPCEPEDLKRIAGESPRLAALQREEQISIASVTEIGLLSFISSARQAKRFLLDTYHVVPPRDIYFASRGLRRVFPRPRMSA